MCGIAPPSPLRAPLRSEPRSKPPQPCAFPPAVDTLSATSSPRVASGPPAALPTPGTSIAYSGALAARPLSKNPPLAATYRASAPAEPTTLLIGVDNQGEVRFSLLQHSSGDPGLDEMAAAHLKKVTFAAADTPITWGFATFSWGGDAYASASKAP